MITGEIRSQIDQIWNAFWSGGIANPLEVIEQITYLLFLKRLDEQESVRGIFALGQALGLNEGARHTTVEMIAAPSWQQAIYR